MARPAQGDHTTGLALVGAILGALRLAERTGTGQVVETSLYETAVWTQASDFATTAVDQAPVRQRSRENMLLPTANRYPCGDDRWIVFNMPEASGWAKLCKALGKEEWLDDERFADARSRYQMMPVLVPEIDRVLADKSRDEWGVIFDAAGLIWGPVLGLHEVASDEQAHAINLFPQLTDEDIGAYRTVGIPMRFKTADVGPKTRSPKIGEHTLSVLAEFGFEDAEISQLLADNIIR